MNYVFITIVAFAIGACAFPAVRKGPSAVLIGCGVLVGGLVFSLGVYAVTFGQRIDGLAWVCGGGNVWR